MFMRIFEKYSVKVGGGYNHRYNLSDGIVLIFELHFGRSDTTRLNCKVKRTGAEQKA
ncbi:MAG: hypothetical protein IJX76_03330 [Clostridia bacterium]|nr:hypothetical protein [Clostridia bacterium]